MRIHECHRQVKLITRHHDKRVADVVADNDFRLAFVLIVFIRIAHVYARVLLKGCRCRAAGGILHGKLYCIILRSGRGRSRKLERERHARAGRKLLDRFPAGGFRHNCRRVHRLRRYGNALCRRFSRVI